MYGCASAISKSLSLLTFPILTRQFSVQDYGVLDYFLSVSALVLSIFILGQDSSVGRFFYEFNDTKNRRQLISQSLCIQLIFYFTLLPILWIKAEKITLFLINDFKCIPYFKLVILQVPCVLVLNFSKNILKYTFKRNKFLVLTIVFSFFHVLSLLTGIYFIDITITDILLLSLLVNLIFSVLGLYFIKQWLTLPLSLNHFYQMIPFALPYWIISIIGILIPTLERSVTNNLFGSVELGYYAVASKFVMLISLIATSFQMSWGPFSLSLYKEKNSIYIFNIVLKIFTFFVCFIAILINLFGLNLISIIAGAQYEGAFILVFPLVVALCIQATSWITEIGIGISKKTYLILLCYILRLIITFITIHVFVIHFGLVGIGIGVLIGQIVKALLASLFAQKVFRMAWEYKQSIIIFIITIISGFSSLYCFKVKYIITSQLINIVTLFILIKYFYSYMITNDEKMKIYKYCKIKFS